MNVEKLVSVLKCSLLAAALLVLTTTEAPADVLTITHTGTGSGRLDGALFPSSDFLIRALVDTDDRQSFSSGWWIEHLSASISIDGLGDLEFLSPTRHFVNNDLSLVGFSRGVRDNRGADLFDGPSHEEFATWDMLGPIGPIDGEAQLIQWNMNPRINTTGGILIFDGGFSDTTFTAVPEPATLAIFVVGGFALIVRRHR